MDYRVDLALVSAAVTLGCTGLVLVVYQLRAAVRNGRRLEARYEALQDRVLALTDQSQRLNRIHHDMERSLKRLGLRQDQVELNRSDERPYSHAISMVKKGAGVEDLIAACGLSRGEAELICMVHGLDKQPGTGEGVR